MITFIKYLLGAKKAADEKNCKLKIRNSLASGNPVKMKMTKQLCERDDPSEAYLETLENRTRRCTLGVNYVWLLVYFKWVSCTF